MNIEISTDRLEADINKMQENLDNLRNAKDQVYRCLQQLNSMWEGKAQMVFNNQTRIDEMIMMSLCANINNLIECMQYAKSEYIRCNEDVNSKIASIRLSNDT